MKVWVVVDKNGKPLEQVWFETKEKAGVDLEYFQKGASVKQMELT